MQNFKEILAKQGAAVQEQGQEARRGAAKISGNEVDYEAGVGRSSTRQSQAKTDLAKAPADQRDAKKQEMKDLSDKAVTELEAAKAAAGEKDGQS